ncbi:MAG: peptidoglycan-associated lipoprotein Pal [Gammaproteobacteria bacterium]|nr:peptidoglycan-associated lipoprotein Pal [Gammaproteobacteria bacterium]
MKHVAKLVVALVPLVLLIGCGSKGPAVETKEPEVQMQAEDSAVPLAEEATPLAAEDRSSQSSKPVADDALAQRKIYFDFDSSDVKPEYRRVIDAHAKHLAANPDATVTIEGHCDERGTREYNMALGERRANSVLRMLTAKGVSASQVRTVSFGEENPEVDGHDESAWVKNRRAIFVY